MDSLAADLGKRATWRTWLLHRWTVRVFLLLVVLLLLWAFRRPVLRSLGGFLIRQDELAHADALYVLGGSPVERTLEGMRLMHAGHAPVMIFTGSSPNENLRLFAIDTCEGGLGRRVAVLSGFDSTRTRVLRKGTSTFEEAEGIRDLALAEGQDTVIVVTTDLHTRRVRGTFRKVLVPAGITVIVRAAPSLHYDVQRWWRSEEGLLMVNNEYMKLLYYALQH